jgi:hypothetical protein
MAFLSSLLPALFMLATTEGDPLEQAVWERVQVENKVPIFELYLQLFPDGPHAGEVQDRWFDRTHRGDPSLLPQLPVPHEQDV